MDVSVVVPTYQSNMALELLLCCLEKQTLPRERFEVVVVDDGSTDDTGRVLDAFRGRLPLTVIRHDRNRGRSQARNTGILAARAPYVILCDSHMLVPPRFVEAHLALQASGEDLVVSGVHSGYDFRIYSLLEEEYPENERKEALALLEQSEHFRERKERVLSALTSGHGRARVLLPEDMDDWHRILELSRHVLILPSAKDFYEWYGHSLEGCPVPWLQCLCGNVSMPRRLVLDVGLFDTAFHGWGLEDFELGFRLHERGARFLFAPDVAVPHQYHPESPTKGDERLENYKYFFEKHPKIEIALYLKKSASRWGLHRYCQVLEGYRALQERNEPEVQSLLDAFYKLAAADVPRILAERGRRR